MEGRKGTPRRTLQSAGQGESDFQADSPYTWRVSPAVSSSSGVHAVVLSSYPCQQQLRSLLKCKLPGRTQRFWFSGSGVGPSNLHSLQASQVTLIELKWCTDLENSGLWEQQAICHKYVLWYCWVVISLTVYPGLPHVQKHNALMGPDKLRWLQPRPDPCFPGHLVINTCLTVTGLCGFMVPHLISTTIH